MIVAAGISITEYWQLSPEEYDFIIEGFQFDQGIKTTRHKDIMIMLREMIGILYNSNVKKANRKTAKQLIPFTDEIKRKNLDSRLDKRDIRNEPRKLKENKKQWLKRT